MVEAQVSPRKPVLLAVEAAQVSPQDPVHVEERVSPREPVLVPVRVEPPLEAQAVFLTGSI